MVNCWLKILKCVRFAAAAAIVLSLPDFLFEVYQSEFVIDSLVR
ncbi:unnamed protein product, partial [Rotaria sordida]